MKAFGFNWCVTHVLLGVVSYGALFDAVGWWYLLPMFIGNGIVNIWLTDNSWMGDHDKP